MLSYESILTCDPRYINDITIEQEQQASKTIEYQLKIAALLISHLATSFASFWSI